MPERPRVQRGAARLAVPYTDQGETRTVARPVRHRRCPSAASGASSVATRAAKASTEYLRRALGGTAPFFVVPSSRGVNHRVTIGDGSARIPGFYLYKSRPKETPAGPTTNSLSAGGRRRCGRLRVRPETGHPQDPGRSCVVAVSRGHQCTRVYVTSANVGALEDESTLPAGGARPRGCESIVASSRVTSPT